MQPSSRSSQSARVSRSRPNSSATNATLKQTQQPVISNYVQLIGDIAGIVLTAHANVQYSEVRHVFSGNLLFINSIYFLSNASSVCLLKPRAVERLSNFINGTIIPYINENLLLSPELKPATTQNNAPQRQPSTEVRESTQLNMIQATLELCVSYANICAARSNATQNTPAQMMIIGLQAGALTNICYIAYLLVSNPAVGAACHQILKDLNERLKEHSECVIQKVGDFFNGGALNYLKSTDIYQKSTALQAQIAQLESQCGSIQQIFSTLMSTAGIAPSNHLPNLNNLSGASTTPPSTSAAGLNTASSSTSNARSFKPPVAANVMPLQFNSNILTTQQQQFKNANTKLIQDFKINTKNLPNFLVTHEGAKELASHLASEIIAQLPSTSNSYKLTHNYIIDVGNSSITAPPKLILTIVTPGNKPNDKYTFILG